MTKRDKQIGVGIIGGMVLLGAIFFVIIPFWDAVKDTAAQHANVREQLVAAEATKEASNVLKPVWNELVNNGLKLEESTAQSLSRQAIDEWARRAGLSLDSLNLEGTTQQGGFQVSKFVVTFPATGATSMKEMGKMLWALETASIPIRITEMKISSTREGTDQLMVQLNISALYLPKAGEAKVGAPPGGASTGGEL